MSKHDEGWQWAWRDCIAPEFHTETLEALVEELKAGGPNLCQGAISSSQVGSGLIESACAIGFCSWREKSLKSACEVANAFHDFVARLGNSDTPFATSVFIDFFDSRPRDEVIPLLLKETEIVLEERRRQFD